MGAYDSLKSLVRQYIKTNGQNEITGQILQNVLIAMIDDLGITIDSTPTNGSPNAVASGGVYNALKTITDFLNNGYYFLGIAGTSTMPDSVTQYGIFYIASDGGTYTNFLNGDDEPLTLYQGLNILYKDVEDDGWNYFEVFKFSDFVDTTQQQSLSTQQKAQARTNIAAVSYDQQSLNADQQVQAQNNMMGKSYNAEQFSGLGKKVLAKNVITVSGVNKNVMTQAFFDDTQGNHLTNTVFIIQYDYTLGENVELGAGCTLQFDGGSISSGGTNKDTITGNNSGICAESIKILDLQVKLEGTWNVKIWYTTWFGLKPNDSILDFSVYISHILDIFGNIYPKTHWSTGHYFGGTEIKIAEGKYYGNTTINIDSTKLCSVTMGGTTPGSVVIYNQVAENTALFSQQNSSVGLWECTFSNMTFISSNGSIVFDLIAFYNSNIRFCSFYAGRKAIRLGLTCGTRIDNCTFVQSIEQCIELHGSGFAGPNTTFYIRNCWAQHVGVFLTAINTQGSEIEMTDSAVEYSTKAFDVHYIYTGNITRCYFEQNETRSYAYQSYLKFHDCFFVDDPGIKNQTVGHVGRIIITTSSPTDSLSQEGDILEEGSGVRNSKVTFGNGAFYDYMKNEAVYHRHRINTVKALPGYSSFYELTYKNDTDSLYFHGIIGFNGTYISVLEKFAGNTAPMTDYVNSVAFGDSEDIDLAVTMHLRHLPDYIAKSGPTSSRPTNVITGFEYFDTTLSKPIYKVGNGWVDSTGTSV